MADAFEIEAKDGAGRIGRLHVAGRTVTTPALLPVVHPDQRSVPIDVLDDLGIQAVIANAYSLFGSDRRDEALDQGVHEVLGYDGVVMTDSGTFQAHVYGDVDVTNEEILDFQAQIGSDIATILDVFAELGDSPDELRDGVETTVARAEKAVELYADRSAAPDRVSAGDPGAADDAHATPDSSAAGGDRPADGDGAADGGHVADGDRAAAGRADGGERGATDEAQTPGLALPIQGGTEPALRREAAARVDELPGLIYPIGGVVPLMEQQRIRTLARVIAAAKQGLGVDKPVHLFGCGHPRILPLAVLLGCDLFDSASYAKYAHEGRYIVPEGTLHLDDLLGGDLPCACPVCVDHTPGELGDAAQQEPSPLAEHNLRVLVAEIRRTRAAIRRGDLFELAMRRAQAHPRVADALNVLEDDRDRLLALDPETKSSALTYVGPMTRRRPEVARYRRRLKQRLLAAWQRAAEATDAGPVVVEVPWTAEIAEGHGGPLLAPDQGLTAEVADRMTAAGVFVVHQTPIGPVPRVLLGHFPAGQVVAPRETTPTETEEIVHATRRLVDRLEPAKSWVWDSEDVAEQALDAVKELSDGAGRPLDAAGTAPDVEEAPDAAGRTLDAAGQTPDAAEEAPDAADRPLSAAATRPPAPWSPVWPRPRLEKLDAERRVGLARLAAGTIQQLGADAAAALLGPDPSALDVETSRTGRVRSVRLGGEHLLARRARDGHINLGPAGARRLHRALDPPRLRVPVTEDSVPYNRDGRSVFAGFVLGDGLDPDLPAAAECLIVDADDALVAYGTAQLSADEMVAFEQGVAVDVRDGVEG